MKSLLVAAIIGVVSATACRKIVEDVKKDYIIGIMTSGQWYVESYMEADSNITAEFSGFYFQFRENGTVNGSSSQVSEEGTWAGDVTDYSITSYFPVAGDPIRRLNGKWLLKDSAEDYVLAHMTTPQGKNILKLRKKQ